jgi:hypothetical protein
MASEIVHPNQPSLEELRKMTTEDVVERVLANQLVGHILSRDNIQQGIDVLARDNHLFMELLHRPAEAGPLSVFPLPPPPPRHLAK